MSTPSFVPQDQTSLKPVRFYTALDPYYFTIDNRPLKDLNDNIRAIGTGGSDAGRRAALLTGLYLGSVSADSFTPEVGSNATMSYTGLGVSNPSSNVIRISTGSVFERRLLNASNNQYVLKQAISLQNQDFNVPSPGVFGRSITYTIEGQFVEITSDTIAGSQLPYIDPLNPYLPSTLTNGELLLSIVAGAAATTGSHLPPAVTPGKFPLYYLTVADTSNVPTVTMATNAPWRKGFDARANLTAISANSAAVVLDNESPCAVFNEGVVSGVNLSLQGAIKQLNPFKPLKVRLLFASSIATGDVKFRIRYKSVKVGDLLNVAHVNTGIDTIGVGGTANVVQAYTTVNAVIPNSVFSSFSSGEWGISVENLNIILDRLGNDVGDTNTGALTLIRASLVQ